MTRCIVEVRDTTAQLSDSGEPPNQFLGHAIRKELLIRVARKIL